MNAQRIKALVRLWRWTYLARDLCYVNGVGCAAMAAFLLWPDGRSWTWKLGLAAMLGTLAIRLTNSRWWTLDAARLARHLDRVHPELEESSELWLRDPAQLTLLEQLQLKRIDSAVYSGKFGGTDARDFGRPPRGILLVPFACWFLGLALCGIVLLARYPRPASDLPARHPAAPPVQAAPTPPAAPAWPKLTAGRLMVTPPAYMGRPARPVDELSAEVEEGSSVVWTLAFDQPVRDARLVFGESAADVLPLAPAPGGAALAATRTISETALYHLTATLADGRVWNPPELYSLKAIKDHPPTVRIVRPEQPRTLIDPPPAGQPAPRVEVEVAASDDYGVGAARLVATVAKGSGEAVKFREQTLPFDTDTPDPASPRGRRFGRTLDFGALGLEPGDELYFFVEVQDNRQPTPNRTRSETRFLVLKGPEETATTAGRGITGVNLVPEYFRSERQIIIDTEKLIADRPHISDAELRQRSNDLGGDQQLLRLRYGQFLGEELEEGTGDHNEVHLNPLQAAPPERASGPRAAASVTIRFRQEHEQQDREGGSDEQRDAHANPAPEVPLPAAQAVAPFVDQHDSQDKATLFDNETKGTMRDALGAMWEAERHLRVMQLEAALPAEHKALEILKELQQSARSYVQRVGFEAPPLKVAERRFKGDVAGVPPRAAQADTLPPGNPALGAVRAALADLPWQAPGAMVLDTRQRELLGQIEPALTAAATRQPETFLEGLQALRTLRGDSGAGAAAPTLLALERALLRLLPPAGALPVRAPDPAPGWSRAYTDALQAAAGEKGTAQ